MNPSRFSIDEAIGFGWGVAKRNVVFFLLVIIVSAVASGILQSGQDATKASAPFISLLFALAGLFVSQVLAIGFTRITLKFVDGAKPELADLFSGYPLFIKFLLASLLYGLVVAAGLILLIVPGIIWAVRYSQFGYLVVDRGLGPTESLRQSAEITRGARWQLFLLFLILIGVILLGALALGIGLIWAVPTAMVASAYVYRKLAGQAAVSGLPAPAAPPIPA
jgi:uncharacterized membrane protein